MDYMGVWKRKAEEWAKSPWAAWLLALSAVIEAAIFPISVDVPLITMGALRPRRSLYYAFLVAFGSFIGGFIGYAIGYYFFPSIANPLIEYFGIQSKFQSVLSGYRDHSIVSLVFAGFLPVPYIVFTFAAGYHDTVPLVVFALGAFLGRFLRFYAVGIPLYLFGERAESLLLRFRFVSLVLAAVLVIAAIAIGRWLP